MKGRRMKKQKTLHRYWPDILLLPVVAISIASFFTDNKDAAIILALSLLVIQRVGWL